MGAAALQKYWDEHPGWAQQQAARARQAAVVVNRARFQKARELREREQARARLISRYPKNASRAEQIKWLRDQMLKLARAAVAPPPGVLPALKGVLACVLAMPPDSDGDRQTAERARIAFLERELKHSDALRQEAGQRAQKAEQRIRELKAKPAAPVAIEQPSKAAALAAGPAAGAASPLEFYVRADAEGVVYFGRDYDSCCRAPARRVTQSPGGVAIGIICRARAGSGRGPGRCAETGRAAPAVVIPATRAIRCRRRTCHIARTTPLVARHCGMFEFFAATVTSGWTGGVFPMANELAPRTTRIGACEDQS